MFDMLIVWFTRAMVFASVIMYGAMGEIVTEKSGNLNLGIPGVMYVGAISGVIGAFNFEQAVKSYQAPHEAADTFLTVFALACLYPFVYAISASISGREAVEYSKVVLFPKDIQFKAFSRMFNDNMFWNSYSNTLFITLYGTIWALGVAILGAYALSKKRLLFRKFFNFFLVFTMWFSAGLVPQYLNYLQTKKVFNGIGIFDDKWLVVIAMGMAAMNIILLRNAFEGVPSEIEEAAIVDGATEMQVLTNVSLYRNRKIWAFKQLFISFHFLFVQLFLQLLLPRRSDTLFHRWKLLCHLRISF